MRELEKENARLRMPEILKTAKAFFVPSRPGTHQVDYISTVLGPGESVDSHLPPALQATFHV